MNRRILYAAGGHLLYLAVIGWLWTENQSLHKLTTDRDSSGRSDRIAEGRHGERLARDKPSGSQQLPATPVAGNPAPKPVRKPGIQKIETGTGPNGVTVVTMPQAGGSPESPENPESNENLSEGKRRPCCWPGCKHR